LWHTLLGWPQLYRSLYLPWARTLPLLALTLLAALAHQVITKLRWRARELLCGPAGVVLWVAFCFSLLRPTYVEVRYAFFIYPVILCVIVLSFTEAFDAVAARIGSGAQRQALLAASGVYLGLFALTGDFSPRHIFNVTDDRVVFRLDGYEKFRRVWYSRSDFASPAEFLNRAASSEDRIIVVNQPPVSYYVRKPHAVYYDRSNRRFTNVSRSQGTVDLWSSRPLLSTAEDLRSFTRSASTVWLVRAHDPSSLRFDPGEVWRDRMVQTTLQYVGRDGAVEVLQVELVPESLRAMN
jgi:hypothetical protein